MENTLLMDNNPTKSILKPLGNIIFPKTWTSNKKDTFLMNVLATHLRNFAHHPYSIPDFVLPNPIGNEPLPPTNDIYKAIRRLVEVNNLI